MSADQQRIHDMVELDAWLFGGVPEGPYRERYVQRQAALLRSPSSEREVLEIIRVNFETGEITFHDPPSVREKS